MRVLSATRGIQSERHNPEHDEGSAFAPRGDFVLAQCSLISGQKSPLQVNFPNIPVQKALCMLLISDWGLGGCSKGGGGLPRVPAHG